jgi:acyl-CoA hydrolase
VPTKIDSPEVIAKGMKYELGFASPLVRPLLATRQAAFVHGYLSKFSELLTNMSGSGRLTTVVHAVSKMDKHGFFSLGVDNANSWSAYRNKPGCKLILEVNENMPRTHGSSFHISEADAVIENNMKLIEMPTLPAEPEDEIIAQYVSELVPDEATIQLGIGALPTLIGQYLDKKHDLGVHSELIVDSMLDLYEKGVITGRKKTFMPHKMLATLVLGRQSLYDFVDDNPMVNILPANYVNNPYIASQNDLLISVNQTLQVDLRGQCNSESIGHVMYSGVGGQMDFIRAATMSKGGKAILCTHSTYKDKQGKLHPKIVPTLDPGSVVTVSASESMYIVTEYGVANMQARPTDERIESLIRISHPDFRDWLWEEVNRLKLA